MKFLLLILISYSCLADRTNWIEEQLQDSKTRAEALTIAGNNSGNLSNLPASLTNGLFNSSALGGQLSSVLGNFGGGQNQLMQIAPLLQGISNILNLLQILFGGQSIANTATNNSQLLAQNAEGLSTTDDAGPNQCARGVRLILERLGIASPTGIGSAKDWEPWLQNSSSYGKVPVSSVSQAPIGSIVVFNTGEHGHIAIVGLDSNGNRIYVSDKGRYTYEETRSGFTGVAYVPL